MIASINLKLGVVLLRDGRQLRITSYLDSNGDLCDPEPEEAVAAVIAGPDEGGYWYGALISNFEPVTYN